MMGVSAVLVAAPAQANTERALYIHYTHTKETSRIVFKRNGQYVQSGLNELNYFLRDWRRNEPTKMDPRLFDLVWEVYQEVGATQPINVVSAYRSPATNAMLAKNSSGVADDSQHMRGTAMDFFIPGVPLAKLRATAMKKQVGGVGFYPTSGSPFVHLDTGSVRAWPRMTRAQLKELFPDGRTMHVPTDGKPISQEGYQVALAEWKRCHSYPCSNSSSGTQVASSGGGSGRTLMDVLFGGNSSQNNTQQPAPAAAAVRTASVEAAQRRIDPAMPVMRPTDLGALGAPAVAQVAATPAVPFSSTGSAPLTPEERGQVQQVAIAMPVAMPQDLRIAAASVLPTGDAVSALAALTAPTMPTPRVIMSEAPAETLTAYLPANTSEGTGRNALETLIDNATRTGAVAAAPTSGLRLPSLPTALSAAPALRSASLGAHPADPMSGLFAQTFGASGGPNSDPLAEALARHVAARTATPEMRRPDLVAPDLEHVADIFMAPAAMSSPHFAVIFDRDEADFDPTPEMGRYVLVKGVGDDAPLLGHNRFQPVAPGVSAN